MPTVQEILELLHEVDVYEEHPLYTKKFAKGEFQGLGVLTIEDRGDAKSIRITMGASLQSTFINVVYWESKDRPGKSMYIGAEMYKALYEALNPIFEDSCF